MPSPDREATLLALYRTMARIRAFEDAAEVASRGGLAAWGPQTDQAAGGVPAQVRGPCTCPPVRKPCPQACARI